LIFSRKKFQWYSPGIVLILLCGFALSLLGYFSFQKDEKEHVRDVFLREMDNRYAALDRALNLHKEFLLGLKGLYDGSEYVSRQEFEKYVSPAIKRIAGLHAVEWIPFVHHDERGMYEQKVRDAGDMGFTFTQRDAQGHMVPASERKSYYPVYYLVPFESNKAAFGFDLGSSSLRLQTLEQARDTGAVLVTPKISLVQEKTRQGGILQLSPVYEGEPENVNTRRETLKGFVLGVHRLEDIVERSLAMIKGKEESQIGFSLIDASAPDGENELYANELWSDDLRKSYYYYERGLSIGGRTWKYIAAPTSGYFQSNSLIRPYSALVIGLIITLLLTSYIRQRLNELSDSRSITQAIIDSALHSMVMIDSIGTVLLFNPAAENVFGYSSSEVVGNNVTMLMPEPFKSNHAQYLTNYLTTGIKKIIGIGREVAAQKKDGRIFPIYLSVSEMERTGEGRRFVGMIVDITKRKQDEAALIEAKEEAETANRTKSEFLNMMSHELRTPLTVILGYLPILTNKDTIPDNAMVAKIAGEMDNSGRHLLTLINDLLDISKIEAGALDLDLQPLSVVDCVTEIVEMFQAKCVEKGLAISSKAEEVAVLADQIRLRQILINLVGNAIKFTDEGAIDIDVQQGGSKIIFNIHDTGIGIAEENIVKIFDVFQQADSTSSRAAEGTGLGLAITRRLVEMHGGEIFLESVEGEGSTFTFTIPVYE